MPSGLWLYGYVALWTLLLIESVVMIAVVRQIGNLHTYWVKNDPSTGLELGVRAPALWGDEMFERPVSLAGDRGKKTLVCFLSTTCHNCAHLMFDLHNWRDLPGVEIVLVIGARKLQTRVYVARVLSVDTLPSDLYILVDTEHGLTDQYKVGAVPYTVVVDEEGYIGAKGTVIKRAEVEGLLLQAEELRRRRRRQLYQWLYERYLLDVLLWGQHADNLPAMHSSWRWKLLLLRLHRRPDRMLTL